jgi:predicted dehydrogenase
VTALRIGVVGVGHMGQRHAEKTLALRESGADVTLAGVADADLERARGVASALGVRAARDAAALFREADAVVVAVPTVHHYEVVRAALEAGLDVLVEKPLAATLEQGQALLELAEQDGRVLQVGHLEWFNAATRMIHSWIRSPRFIEVHRMGPFPARGTDVDVVRDLMIHDIDILQQILGEEPESIEAIGTPVITDKIDIANARVRFPSGCIADLTASRVSKTPRRKMRFFQRDGYFSIDFLAQSASIHQHRGGEAEVRSGGRAARSAARLRRRGEEARRADQLGDERARRAADRAPGDRCHAVRRRGEMRRGRR